MSAAEQQRVLQGQLAWRSSQGGLCIPALHRNGGSAALPELIVPVGEELQSHMLSLTDTNICKCQVSRICFAS